MVMSLAPEWTLAVLGPRVNDCMTGVDGTERSWLGWCGWFMERGRGWLRCAAAVAVLDRWIFCGSGSTTSGASAEDIVIVRWSCCGGSSWMIGQLWCLGMSAFSGEFGLWNDSDESERNAFSASFSRSKYMFGFESARIWGSSDRGRDIGRDLGRNFLSDMDDFCRLWLNFVGICGTSGAGSSAIEGGSLVPEVRTVEVRETGSVSDAAAMGETDPDLNSADSGTRVVLSFS